MFIVLPARFVIARLLKPNPCARASTRAVARDEGRHAPFAYLIADLQRRICAAAIADERDNYLLVGMAGLDWIDLIRLLFEGFEILVIDFGRPHQQTLGPRHPVHEP